MKKKAVYLMLAAMLLCACTGCKKKEKVQQTEAISETVDVQNETAAQKDDEKMAETTDQTAEKKKSKTQEETVRAAGTVKGTGEEQTEAETEQIEIGGEDSWEDSAEGWD